ncbi:CO(2)-response secreted protease [Sesamum angolense]|uniref:CO(2)-response secreted protease n=1 Tax=Sesamum angolense TaxID=2727404 RepID=A0AAE1XFD8_9LAMI|nr:CO(2)-response secreted protease [Sesamum angolense]
MCRIIGRKPYIVYMGSSLNDGGGDYSSHLQLLSSLIPREESERKFLLNSYDHAFKGFSAMLTENEASVLSGYDEVVSVFPDPVLKLHTTRSWDFLEAADSKFGSRFPYERSSSDVIIGIIDTGIWPESPSFNDHHISKIPSKWKGVCMEGSDFKKSNCNRKLIGARFYSNRDISKKRNETSPTQSRGSPRDFVGHGTHTASTAGGVPVANASYYGLAGGTARGGLPSARIASYKACTLDGCAGSIILKAIDDAIKDGVDIISISIGVGSIFQSDFLNDPIAIGAFHAEQMGVPHRSDFQSTLVLGNNESYKKLLQISLPASDARNCIPGSLDPKKVAGKIIVCKNDEPNVSRRIKKLVVEDAKAEGVIIIDGERETTPFDSGTYPFAEVGQTVGSRSSVTSTPLGIHCNYTSLIRDQKLQTSSSCRIFLFKRPWSSHRKHSQARHYGPGVAILAAVVPKIESFYGAPGNKSSLFSIKSGTSMACPHVTGAMAFIKSVHPHWSFSLIKSALITTASVSNNMGKTLTNTSDSSANPHQVGAGEIRPIKALDPGLAFDTTINDHLSFLCYYGYKQERIRSMSNTNFTCPKHSTEELISNINYPTISIGRLSQHEGPRKVKRIATNVGSTNATQASFKVFFDGKEASKGYNFGDIRWFDGSHLVRIAFAVNIK